MKIIGPKKPLAIFSTKKKERPTQASKVSRLGSLEIIPKTGCFSFVVVLLFVFSKMYSGNHFPFVCRTTRQRELFLREAGKRSLLIIIGVAIIVIIVVSVAPQLLF